MPTEDDLRVAFRDMERLAPDAADVLRAVYDRPRRSARWRHLPPLVPRRPALRAALALGAAGAVAAGAVIATVAVVQGPATKATSITAPALRTHLLAAIATASGDILYTPAPGAPLAGGQYPAYPQPGQEVHVRVGPAVGSDRKVYKDGEYSFTMPSETALHDYINNYTANLDQGGLQLSGTAMAVNHFNHTWRACHSTFILGFALDAAGIRAEIANGQFTVIGPAELNGQQAIELKFNVPPNNEAPPHVTAERMWVNATTYLPMRDYTRWSNGQQSVFDYVFLPPTPENLAKLRPVVPAGYTRAGCAQATGPKPKTRQFPPPR
jgi:hypothetical protein